MRAVGCKHGAAEVALLFLSLMPNLRCRERRSHTLPEGALSLLLLPLLLPRCRVRTSHVLPVVATHLCLILSLLLIARCRV